MHSEHRERFLERMGPGVAVFPAAPVAFRNNDVDHPYRQDSDFYYLSGFDEPDSVCVLTNQHDEHRFVMFVPPRNPERETWDGPRAGVEGAMARFGADAAFPIDELDEKLPEYLGDVDRLFYRLGVDRSFDERVFRAIGAVRRKARKGIRHPTEIVEPGKVLHAMRLRKSAAELERMRRAAAVTAEAHARARDIAQPGMFEYEVEAEILRAFRRHGGEPAYGSIVASGPNATILHHRRNDRRMGEGDLLLIDAGCEHGCYACDVTRTFAVGTDMTGEQRAVYDVVLGAQQAAIDSVRPGATLEDVHHAALEALVDGLLELGLVEGDRDQVLEDEAYKPFYMHRTSHWLGMDVHDVGGYFVEGHPRPLEPGMVFTVEPGLYVAVDADVEPRWRGIGVRIEDDVVVTEDGREVLTAAIPK
ncbi:MAG: aminopeptidase P N-terminal domain-containing protein [Myxococcota bacterium]